ncbi:MAG: ATP-dependent DNA helicase [Candidatus Woesearchaeota archaeon]
MSDLFPYDEVRHIQDILLSEITRCVEEQKNLIAHAPTGLGKTSASIAGALSNSLKTKKTVFFLTSMLSQHNLALETIKDIRRKHKVKVVGVDIIGKKHMCLQQGIEALNNSEFIDFCKTLREEGRCKYYNNLKKKDELSNRTLSAVKELKELDGIPTNETIERSKKYDVCPYEVSLIVGKDSHVIVTDYHYLFNPSIKDNFLTKLGKQIEDSIIIIDEGHNLPERIKSLASEKLTNVMIKRAMTELDSFVDQNLREFLTKLLEVFEDYSNNIQKEAYISKDNFMDSVRLFANYDNIIEELEDKAETVREEKKQSYLGSIANFLIAWKQEDEGFTRIFSKKPGLREEIQSLSYRCLDPGVISRPIIAKSSSTIIMSGTLTPTNMYREVLGFDEATELTLKSPFPEDNRLNLIVPKTSTKYTSRGESQYKEIANTIKEIVNQVPGNSAVFIPSYYLRDEIYKYMQDVEKTVFIEHQGMSKKEKEDLLERFKAYKEVGAVLLGITSGSFAEGIDLPGDLLKCVIVVGLPLQVPDLETKALIKYYDYKFGKGWDFGYVYPAFNKTFQSAGRCIRSENDRGVIIFLDERYAWPNYSRCFPESWNMKTSKNYTNLVKDFFLN